MPEGLLAALARGEAPGRGRDSGCGVGVSPGRGESLGPGPRLGQSPVPATTRRALLLPGALGEIQLDGPVPVAMQIHRAMTSSRRGAASWRGEWLAGPRPAAVAGRGVSRAPPPELDAAGPPPPPTRRPGREIEAVFDIAIQVVYGEVIFDIPLSWFLSYYAEGRESGTHEALDWLWRGYRGAAESLGATTASLDDRVKCWNIDPSIATNGVSDDAFFTGSSGARQYVLNAMRLAATYSEFAEEEWSGSDRCEGFPPFMRKLLSGKAAVNRENVRCTVAINVRSIDPRFDSEWSRSCVDGKGSPCGTKFCEEDSAGAPPFDSWTPVWTVIEDSTGKLLGGRIDYLDPSGDVLLGPPGSVFGCAGGDFGIQLAAHRTSFYGYVLDYAMYWARVLMDYGHETSDELALWSARRIALWALATVADLSDTLIHEAGHVWMGGLDGHCCATCCFDIAASAWSCRVRAWLGLPVIGSLMPDLHDPVQVVWLEATCGAESGACLANEDCYSTYLSWCDLREAGEPKQEAVYWASTCEFPDGGTRSTWCS